MMQRGKRLTSEQLAENAMVARDNLKIKSLARYKTIMQGDVQMYQEIENRLIDLATIKGRAFDDSSMEEYERGVESDLEERGMNQPDNNFGRKSENSERLGSIDSDKDYWQEFEVRKVKHNNRERTIKARNEKTKDEAKQAANMKRQAMQRFDDLGKKIESMKKAHEVEVRTLKKTARKA